MQQNYKNYNSALWDDIIEDISKKAIKYQLREIDCIKITQSELDKILEAENLKYQKLLFTMLCYAKLYNLISENNNCWINTDIKEIYRVARVTVRYRNDKLLYLNDLEQMGLISFSNKNDNLNIRVNFVDMNGDKCLEINDFRELGYEYLNYIKDGKFVRCSECQKLFNTKSNNKSHCNECQKKITQAKTCMRVRNYRIKKCNEVKKS